MQIWYSLPEVDANSRYNLTLDVEFDLHRPREQESVAELAAKDYFHNHNFGKCSWPQKIEIFPSSIGDPIAVDLESNIAD